MASSRLGFRCPELDDIDVLTGWINDERVRRFLDHRVFPVGRESERAFVERASRDTETDRKDVVFIVEAKADGRPVAITGLHGIQWIPRIAEWGILVAPEEQGQGFGAEIGTRILTYAFEELALHRVGLRVSADHTRAIRCYEKAGFIEEGRLREAFWSRGLRSDLVVMSVIARDFGGADAGATRPPGS